MNEQNLNVLNILANLIFTDLSDKTGVDKKTITDDFNHFNALVEDMINAGMDEETALEIASKHWQPSFADLL